MPYFLIGLIIRDFNLDNRVKQIITSYIAIIVSVMGVTTLTVYSFVFWGGINYRSPLYLTFSLFFALILFSIGYKIIFMKQGKVKKWLIRIGKDSFTIYLVHLPLAGIVSNILSRTVVTSLLIVIYPLIIISIVELVLYALRGINKKLDMSWVFRLIGAKQ